MVLVRIIKLLSIISWLLIGRKNFCAVELQGIQTVHDLQKSLSESSVSVLFLFITLFSNVVLLLYC